MDPIQLWLQNQKKKTPAPSWTAGDVEATGGQYAGGATTGPSSGGGGTSYVQTPTPNLNLAPSISIPGYDPDYSSLLASDPDLLAGQADLGAFEGQLGDARRAAIRRAVIAAGLAPGTGLADVDEQTRLAASQNQFSGLAELNRGRDRTQADLASALGARGMIYSGGQSGGNARIQEGYERGTTGLTQQLLDQIAQYEGDFSSKLSGVRAQYAQLKQAAAARIAADPRYQPIGETDAVLDPASGMYMTPDGRWYNAQGQRVEAPTRSAGPSPSQAGGSAPATSPAGTSAVNQSSYTYAPANDLAQQAAQEALTAAQQQGLDGATAALAARSAALNAMYGLGAYAPSPAPPASISPEIAALAGVAPGPVTDYSNPPVYNQQGQQVAPGTNPLPGEWLYM